MYAYTAAELKTFHCERVRKMPLSGLDPSMLLGFLCKDKEDWEDFRRRVVEVSELGMLLIIIICYFVFGGMDIDSFFWGGGCS